MRLPSCEKSARSPKPLMRVMCGGKLSAGFWSLSPGADAGHPLSRAHQRLDGLPDQVAHAPPLGRADESADQLDVVHPRAAGDEERAHRRRADGGLETPELVLPDD